MIAVSVSAGVFGGPLLETYRRKESVRDATTADRSGGGRVASGYELLVEAEQQRAYRIAALMTGRSDRATAIVEEAFAHILQRWKRLSSTDRVRYVLSSVVQQSIGDGFVGRLTDGLEDAAEPDERLRRAARVLATLEPTRRAVVVLSERERFSAEEVAALTRLAPDRVEAELARGLEELGPVLETVAA